MLIHIFIVYIAFYLALYIQNRAHTYFFHCSPLSSFKTFLYLYLFCVHHLLVFLRHHFLCHFSQATVSVKISNFLNCFCSFDFCLVLYLKKTILSKRYILYCLVLSTSGFFFFFNLVCFQLFRVSCLGRKSWLIPYVAPTTSVCCRLHYIK